MNIFRFTTFLALMVGGMEVMQPFAGALASIAVDPFRRRQTATSTSTIQGPTCGTYCESIVSIVASNVSHWPKCYHLYTAINLMQVIF